MNSTDPRTEAKIVVFTEAFDDGGGGGGRGGGFDGLGLLGKRRGKKEDPSLSLSNSFSSSSSMPNESKMSS